MNLFRKLLLAGSTLAILTSMAVVAANAQPGRARWEGNNGRHLGWYNQRYNRRFRNNRYGNFDRYSVYGARPGYLSWRERRRLERQRYRLYNQRNRYYSDGFLNNRERRRLSQRYRQYRYNVRRDRWDY